MTLPAYVSRRFLVTFLRVMGIIAALIFIVEFVEHVRRYSDEASGIGQILTLTALRVPESLGAAFSLIMLISSISLFASLARSSEMVIFRASGISAMRLVFIPVGIAILIGFLVIAILNPIVAGTQRNYEIMRSSLSGNAASFLSISEGGLWLRQATNGTETIIQARRANPDGSLLFEPVFYVFAANGTLNARVSAKEAVLRDDKWVLSNVDIWEQSENPLEAPSLARQEAVSEFATNLTSDQILDSFAPPESISFWDLPSFINQMERSGFTATRHRQYLQTTLATPLLFSAMVLIGAAFTMRHVRFGNTGVMILFAVLSGFALYILRNLSSSLGSAGEIPVMLAAWAPPMAAILLILGYLLHIEDG